MAELATQHLVSGTARLTGAATIFLMIGFGVALGSRTAALLPPPRVIEPLVLPDWTEFAAVFLVTLALVARAEDRTPPPLPDAARPYAEQAAAIVYAPRVRQGSLLMLRGGVGDAWLTLRDEAGWCPATSLEFLFGDFDGSDIGISAAGPIMVLIMRPELAQQLHDGDDVASKGLEVRYAADLGSDAVADADVILLGDGLRESGIVLDLDMPFFTNIFGTDAKTCSYKTWRAALLDEGA